MFNKDSHFVRKDSYWKSEDKNDMPPNNSLQPTAPSAASPPRSQRLSSVPLGGLTAPGEREG